MKVKNVMKAIAKVAADKPPAAFLVAGTAGFVATVAMAVRAAEPAKRAIESAPLPDKSLVTDTDVMIATVKAAAPYYAPVVLVGTLSLCSFYAGAHFQNRKMATLAAAASIGEQALITYQGKVIERFGQDVHEELITGVADDILSSKVFGGLDDTDEKLGSGIMLEGNGNTLCFDKVTGRYFHSTPEQIRAAENVIVKRCMDELSVPLNDFYEELGLSDVSIIGEAIGWDAAKIRPDIRFSSSLDPEGRLPVLVLNYHTCMVKRGLLEQAY